MMGLLSLVSLLLQYTVYDGSFIPREPLIAIHGLWWVFYPSWASYYNTRFTFNLDLLSIASLLLQYTVYIGSFIPHEPLITIHGLWWVFYPSRASIKIHGLHLAKKHLIRLLFHLKVVISTSVFCLIYELFISLLWRRNLKAYID